MEDDTRKETGSFTYSVKTKTGYSMKMTGKIYGAKHGTVCIAALDSQLADDVKLLAAAPELLQSLKEIMELTDDPANDADPEESAFANARAVIAKAEGRHLRSASNADRTGT